ncbi:Retrovirus-related Pol polyprotein from transposon 17.6, partial [Mucuna pruriens]
MPFGLKNVGAIYQRAMVALFHEMMHKEIEVYVDDMIVKSKTSEQHLEDLRKLFERLQKYKLKLNPAKCTFRVKSGKLLSFVVNERGIEVDPDEVKGIREMPTSSTKLELTTTFISIFKLLYKSQKTEWNPDCQEAFKKIKKYLENPLVLVPVVRERPLILYLTVLEESMGYILGQQDAIGKKEQTIYYLSKKFTDCEKRYPALERTCYTLVWALKRLRQYMLANTTCLISKTNPIKYIFEKSALIGRIARWQMALSKYDIVYTSQKAIKESVLVEHLAYHPVSDYQPLLHEFPDEHIMTIAGIEPELDKWTLWFDGASNLLENRIGVVLGFDCINNMAEYEACAMGITMALEHQVKKLKVFGDSALVIYQLRGKWEMRDTKLIPYYSHVKEMSELFNKITFYYIPQEENQMVDALATLSAMVHMNQGQEMSIHVRHQSRVAHYQQLDWDEAKVDNTPWYHDIKGYLEKGVYPEGVTENDERTLRRLASRFF